MTAAPVVRAETPAYFQPPATNPGATAAKEALQELVHELRQPLSAIEAIAYYVEMTLPPELLQARQHMHRLQELVAQAESALAGAALAIRKPAAAASTAKGAS